MHLIIKAEGMKTQAAILYVAVCCASASASRHANWNPVGGRHLLQDAGNTAAAGSLDTTSTGGSTAAAAPGTAEGLSIAVPAANVNITVPNIPLENVTSTTLPATNGTTIVIGTPAGDINITRPAADNTTAPTTGAAGAASALPVADNMTATANASEVPTTFGNISEAVAFFDYLSILKAALNASGLAANITNDTAWTVLAPTNTAFIDRLATLGLTPQQLLLPENNSTLKQVLALHIIPSGAVLSSQLTDGRNLTTALPNGNLTVNLTAANGNVTFVATKNSAIVIVPNIRAGASVIHVINDVLLPADMMPENGTAVPGNASRAGNNTATTGAPVVPVPATAAGVLPGKLAAPAVDANSPVVASPDEIGVNTTGVPVQAGA